MEEPVNHKKLPETDSIRELARIWDSMDLTDFEDQLEEVGEPVFVRRSAVRIALEPSEAEAVTVIANSKGVDSAELIREWIIEKIGDS